MDKSEIGRALQLALATAPESKDSKDLTRVAKLLSACKRTDIESECRRCGNPITGTTKSRWCSPACSQAAYRERKAKSELSLV